MTNDVRSSSRRMSDAREAEILAAALERLAERGYEALTMDEVAAAAHMSKATLYRQWGGKSGLIRAALEQFSCIEEPLDTGSLRSDLLTYATSMPAGSEERDRLLAALVHASRREPVLAALLRDRLVRPNEEALGQIFRRAAERREVRAEHPLLGEIGSLLVYAVLGRVLIDGLVPDEAYMRAMVDSVVLPLLGVAAPASPSPASAASTN